MPVGGCRTAEGGRGSGGKVSLIVGWTSSKAKWEVKQHLLSKSARSKRFKKEVANSDNRQQDWKRKKQERKDTKDMPSVKYPWRCHIYTLNVMNVLWIYISNRETFLQCNRQTYLIIYIFCLQVSYQNEYTLNKAIQIEEYLKNLRKFLNEYKCAWLLFGAKRLPTDLGRRPETWVEPRNYVKHLMARFPCGRRWNFQELFAVAFHLSLMSNAIPMFNI